jgi:hypothetical protein
MKALSKSITFLFPFLIISLLIFPREVIAQIQTYWIDTTSHPQENHSFFFTNRPVKLNSKIGVFEFKNKSTKQTDNLFFCLYDYNHDSIMIKYRAHNTSDAYPVDKVENNIFYKVYDDLRIKKGIKHISITVPGYSHTFESPGEYIYATRENVLWRFNGLKWLRSYYMPGAMNGDLTATTGQRVLPNVGRMISPSFSTCWRISYRIACSLPPILKTSPLFLTCTSMGNQLLKEYLLEREKEGIPLSKVYKSILFIGSDASWDSFEPGKGFHNIGQMCDSVRVSGTIKTSP